MTQHEDEDWYTESQPAEVSGPVGTTRTRERRSAQPCPLFAFMSATVRYFQTQPDHTGPPA